MKIFETSGVVDQHGQVVVAGVPFAPGAEVEVTINPKRRSTEEFNSAWQRICAELRGRPGLKDITDESIREEISRYRAGA